MKGVWILHPLGVSEKDALQAVRVLVCWAGTLRTFRAVCLSCLSGSAAPSLVAAEAAIVTGLPKFC